MGGKKSPFPFIQVQKIFGFGVPGQNIYIVFWGVSCWLFVFVLFFWQELFLDQIFAWHVSCDRENLRLRALLSDGHGAERQFWTPRVSYLHGTGLVHALFTCFGTGVGICSVSVLLS